MDEDDRFSTESLSFSHPQAVSYLRARDPSILSWNVCKWNAEHLARVKHNLVTDFNTTGSTSSSSSLAPEKKDEGLFVYLRIKGGVENNNLYKIESNTVLSCAIPEDSQAGRNVRNNTTLIKKYSFSYIFGPRTQQQEIFDGVIKEKVLGLMNGCNCTLLAYGVSGSGKTFSTIGTAQHPGIIPRSLDYLFRTLGTRVNKKPLVKPLPHGGLEILSQQRIDLEINNLLRILNDPVVRREGDIHKTTFLEMERRLSLNPVGLLNSITPILGIWVSFAEIYNEDIYDLLQPSVRGELRPKLKIGGLNDDVYIRGLNWVYVRKGIEAYELLQYGLRNLTYAATSVNQHSSRAHSIFSVKLLSGQDEQHCSVSQFNFCDLAGSERLRKTNNEGARLKESMKINKSLSTLGRCIQCIRDLQKNYRDRNNAPFRESKLTQLFQKGLKGKEDILMMVNINPSIDMFDDTLHALNFSAIAQEIVRERPPSPVLTPQPPPFEDSEDRDEEMRLMRNKYAELVLKISEYEQELPNIIQREKQRVIEAYEEEVQMLRNRISKLQSEVDAYRKIKREQDLAAFKKAMEAAVSDDEDDCIVISDESACDNGILSDHESDHTELTQLVDQNEKKTVINGDLLVGENEALRKQLNELKIEYQTLLEKYSSENGSFWIDI